MTGIDYVAFAWWGGLSDVIWTMDLPWRSTAAARMEQKNACTMLYGAACRAAKALGYRRIITYTRESEPGTSLKASNWLCDGRAGGTHWTGHRYEQVEMQLDEMKVRWRKEL